MRQRTADTSALARGIEAVQEGQGWRRSGFCGNELGGSGEDGGEDGWEEAVPLGGGRTTEGGGRLK